MFNIKCFFVWKVDRKKERKEGRILVLAKQDDLRQRWLLFLDNCKQMGVVYFTKIIFENITAYANQLSCSKVH